MAVQGTGVLMGLAGTAAAVFGVGLMYLSWRKKARRKTAILSCAWFAVASSVFLWSRASGPEFGPVIAILVLPLVAWCVVGANRHVRSNKGKVQEPGGVNRPGFRAVLQHAAIFLVTVPLAACASTMIAIVLSAWLPWVETDRLVLAMLAMPFLWGLGAWWATADPHLLRPTVGLVLGGGLSAAWLFT